MNELTVSNSIRIDNPSKEMLDYCEKNLVIDNPDYIKKERMGFYVGKTSEKIFLYSTEGSSLIVPFGCLRDIFTIVGKNAIYKTGFHVVHRLGMKGKDNLYDYQEKALCSLMKGKNGVLEAPCGSGKTQIGMSLIRSIGMRALWLTHTHKLLKQSEERCLSMFPNAKVAETTEGKFAIGEDITFATVQTMFACDPSLYRDAFDVIVVDEAHHCTGSPSQAKMFYKVVSNCNCRYKFGLSATPNRRDGLSKAMYAAIGPLLHTITKEEVGDKIIKAKHVRVDNLNMYGIPKYSGPDGMLDFSKMTDLLINDSNRNELIANVVLEYLNQGKKQLLLTSRVEHCEALADIIRRFYPQVSVVYGKKKERDRDFSPMIIVATFALAKEGLDIPTLDCVHLCTPAKDDVTIKQSAGRVERNYPGKAEPLVIDYVDVSIPYCVRAYDIRRRLLK